MTQSLKDASEARFLVSNSRHRGLTLIYEAMREAKRSLQRFLRHRLRQRLISGVDCLSEELIKAEALNSLPKTASSSDVH